MEKKKILWLCSWYPSKWEPFNGDFIQRHANAAALYNDIHVIHVTYDLPAMKEMPNQEIKTGNNLTEHIIYFKRERSFYTKLTNHFRWQSIFKRAIRNYIIKNGKPDLVHVQVPMKAGILGLWIKKNYKVPYLITEHWGIYNDIIDKGYSAHGFAFRQLTKKIFRNANRFLSVSKYLAEGVNRLVGSKEYEVIPNVVNTDLFFYQEKKHSIFRFIHVSNMVPLKNVQGILRSFKQLLTVTDQVELILAGDTDVHIRAYASSLNIPPEKLTFKGEITYAEVAIEIQKADCFILFSNIENSPCVIGEVFMLRCSRHCNECRRYT